MNKSIINLLSICLLLTLAGCVHTTLEKTAEGFNVDRRAFLYPFDTSATVDPDTGIISFGYNTDGGQDEFNKAIEAAVKAGIAAGKVAL